MEVMFSMFRSSLLNDLVTLSNTVDQLLGDTSLGEPLGRSWSRANASGGIVAQPMPLDVYATEDNAVILAAVPGMDPNDLDLTVQENTVTLSGSVRSTSESQEAQNATWYIRELPTGTYRRSISLPFAVEADRAEATFDHGILRVVLPKAEALKPKRIAINTTQHQAIDAGGGSKS